MNLENESDKTEVNEADDESKVQIIGESTPETDFRMNGYSGNQLSSDSPANPSVDSSTDTLIPISEPAVVAVNGDNDT